MGARDEFVMHAVTDESACEVARRRTRMLSGRRRHCGGADTKRLRRDFYSPNDESTAICDEFQGLTPSRWKRGKSHGKNS